MADGPDNEQEPVEDAGKLRKELSKLGGQNKDLTAALTAAQAELAIRKHGLSLVKPEDLAGIDPDQVETRAQELEAERVDQGREVLKAQLRTRGVAEGDLDAQIDQMLGGHSADQSAWTSAGELSGVAGSPPAATDISKMSAREKMAFGLQENARRRAAGKPTLDG